MGTLGCRLSKLRKQSKYTQEEVAQKLELTDGAYWHYEKNNSMPPISKLLQLAILYDTSIQYLITGEETGKAYDPENVTPFPERVKVLRKKNHLTQKEAAAALGIRCTAYQAYEYGTHEPKLENLLKLAKLFGVTLDELAGRNEK